jgi:apolipoprotein N-acyltransferase
MQKVISVLVVLVGIIHLLPLSGILGPERLSTLYGINFSEPNLSILMRHRAVLFGLLGLFMIYSVFHPPLLSSALIGGGVSVLSFIWIALSVGGYNNAIHKVVVADIVALICIVVAAVLHFALLNRN